MKKLLVVVACLFATSMLFAQTQTQETVMNDLRECADCGIEQIEAPISGNFIGTASTANQVRIFQTGTNEAEAQQFGNGNESQITQDGKMHGNGNGQGYMNEAYTLQQGIDNESEIGQHGNGNLTWVNQDGERNYSYVDIGVGWAEDNYTEIDQLGNDNLAFQKVRYDNNWASITQFGNQNYAEQDQRSGADAVEGSTATIYQRGSYNQAKQVQDGSLNNATSNQHGDNNFSVETQMSDTAFGGSDVNTSLINQYSRWGMGNKACVEQTSVNGFKNFSDIYQKSGRGGMNTANVWQYANEGNNYTDIIQHGHNSAKVTQVNGVIIN